MRFKVPVVFTTLHLVILPFFWPQNWRSFLQAVLWKYCQSGPLAEKGWRAVTWRSSELLKVQLCQTVKLHRSAPLISTISGTTAHVEPWCREFTAQGGSEWANGEPVVLQQCNPHGRAEDFPQTEGYQSPKLEQNVVWRWGLQRREHPVYHNQHENTSTGSSWSKMCLFGELLIRFSFEDPVALYKQASRNKSKIQTHWHNFFK